MEDKILVVVKTEYGKIGFHVPADISEKELEEKKEMAREFLMFLDSV